MRDHESKNRQAQGLITSDQLGFSDDEPPTAALVLAGSCFNRLAPLYPAILGQYMRSADMTQTLVTSWARAIQAARVDEIDLATAVRQISCGNLGGDPFSFPAVIGMASANRRGRENMKTQPAAPTAPPASAEKVAAAQEEIKRVLGVVANRSRAAFVTKTTAQH